MPSKSKKKTAKRTGARNNAAKKNVSPGTQAPASPDAASNDAASARFVQDLLVRGDAAERTKDGTVPQHATHAIKRKNDGSVEVERVRFKVF
jgi:hypothetical protein